VFRLLSVAHSAGLAEEVVAVSVGSQKVQETIRAALGMGADRGIHIEVENEDDLEPIHVAQLLAKVGASAQQRDCSEFYLCVLTVA
jgi:electron transfer flavoprotein alpha/beta subunit